MSVISSSRLTVRTPSLDERISRCFFFPGCALHRHRRVKPCLCVTCIDSTLCSSRTRSRHVLQPGTRAQGRARSRSCPKFKRSRRAGRGDGCVLLSETGSICTESRRCTRCRVRCPCSATPRGAALRGARHRTYIVQGDVGARACNMVRWAAVRSLEVMIHTRGRRDPVHGPVRVTSLDAGALADLATEPADAGRTACPAQHAPMSVPEGWLRRTGPDPVHPAAAHPSDSRRRQRLASALRHRSALTPGSKAVRLLAEVDQ